jgi:hypothetical protein
MALWGNYDSKTASGTVQVYANGLVSGTGTSFTTQAAAGDFITAGGKDYVVISISNNTVAQVLAGTLGGTIGTVNAGSSYILSEKPTYIALSDATGSNSNTVYGVDTTEAGVAGYGSKVAHAGWVKVTTGSGGRSGRTQYETLVAMGTIAGDAEDTVFPDS